MSANIDGQGFIDSLQDLAFQQTVYESQERKSANSPDKRVHEAAVARLTDIQKSYHEISLQINSSPKLRQEFVEAIKRNYRTLLKDPALLKLALGCLASTAEGKKELVTIEKAFATQEANFIQLTALAGKGDLKGAKDFVLKTDLGYFLKDPARIYDLIRYCTVDINASPDEGYDLLHSVLYNLHLTCPEELESALNSLQYEGESAVNYILRVKTSTALGKTFKAQYLKILTEYGGKHSADLTLAQSQRTAAPALTPRRTTARPRTTPEQKSAKKPKTTKETKTVPTQKAEAAPLTVEPPKTSTAMPVSSELSQIQQAPGTGGVFTPLPSTHNFVADFNTLARPAPQIALNSAELSRFGDIHLPAKGAITVRMGGQEYPIHANAVNLNGRSYIAAQYPKDTRQLGFPNLYERFVTCAATQAKLLVDLTGPSESIPGGLYYPSEAKKWYSLQQRTYSEADQGVRMFLQHKEPTNYPGIQTASYGLGGGKKIRRLHFQHWKDHGGLTVEKLSNLVKTITVEQTRYTDKAHLPTMIHCRAGVGRTGTTIVAMEIYNMFKEGLIDEENYIGAVRRLIREGREQRGSVFVQTADQYEALIRFAEHVIATGGNI